MHGIKGQRAVKIQTKSNKRRTNNSIKDDNWRTKSSTGEEVAKGGKEK